MIFRRVVFPILLLILLVVPADSHASERLIVANLESLYEARRFNELAEYGESLLQNPGSLYLEELAAVHSYLGFAFVILRKEHEAKLHFIEWLKLEPYAELDPVMVPPNIIRIFEMAKRSLQEQNTPSVPTILSSKDQWPQMKKIVWRSMLVPGWGHYYAGDKKRGAILFLSDITLLAGIYFTNVHYIQARDDYYNEWVASKMDAAYEKYNSASKIRVGVCSAYLIFYAATQYDIFNRTFAVGKQTSLLIIPSLINPPNDSSPVTQASLIINF